MSRIKRILSFILAAVLILSDTTAVLADNSGSSFLPPTPAHNSGGEIKKPSQKGNLSFLALLRMGG